MAIAATVKKAPDTSATDFPAPSHVTLSTQLAEVAEDIAHFYSNPGTSVVSTHLFCTSSENNEKKN